MVLGPVGDEALQGADRDRLALLGADAEPLALRLLRADAPGDAGQGVVVEQRLGGTVEIAAGEALDELGDVDAHRAAVDAARVLAVEAALGLFHGQGLGVAEVDLVEVHRADDRRAGRDIVALDLHPFLGGEVGTLGHGAVSPPAASARPSIRQRAALEGGLLGVAVHGQAVGQLLEVDGVGVELGTVHAGVDGLAADADAAAAAHAGAVDHDGVERHGGGHVVLLGHLGDGAHHGHRPDRVDVVDAARLEHVAQLIGDEAVAAVGAVVGADADVAVAAQLVLEDDPLPGPAADDAGDLHALGREALGHGVHDRGAHAAADAHGVAARR